jgi:hypothetical protein
MINEVLGIILLTALSGVATSSAPLEEFSFVVGHWTSKGESFPESYGAAAGPASGTVDCAWGLGHAWISLESTLASSSGGPYTVHVLTAGRAGSAGLTALAVNTMSAVGVAYEGEMTGPGRAVFLGYTGKKWQRVSYSRVDKDRVEILIEESSARDGPWLRHSRATWTRRP